MSEQGKRSAAKTVSVIMLITLLGKVLGLVRDMLLGHNFGVGMASSAFLTASRIPRNFFDVIFASAISASFIPVFNEYLEKKGREEAFCLSNAFITVTALASAVLSVLGMLGSAPLTALLADGFDAPTAALCASLLRVLFPTVFFTGIAFSLVGILQSLGEFNLPAALSLVSNTVIIVYYVLFCERFGVEGLAVAFLLGWAVQAFIQIPALYKRGYRYRFALRHEGLSKVFALMLPVMASTWVQPINLTVATRYASHLNGGTATAALEYANTLYTIVAGVFVLSIANVIFPELSRLSARNEGAAFDESLSGALRGMLFFLVPMSVGLASMAKPIVRLLYEWKEWTAESTEMTASALMFLSLGMLGYGVQMILSRAYYAAQQGKMPLVAGLVSVGLNVALCAVLSPAMGISGLAIASAVSAIAPAAVLLIALRREHRTIFDKSSVLELGKLLLSALVMFVFVLAARYVCSYFPGDGALSRLVTVLVPTFVGMIVYFAAAFVLRAAVLEKWRGKVLTKVGTVIRSSLIIGTLLSLCGKVRDFYYKSFIYRGWIALCTVLGRLADGSVIVGFFRADWDKCIERVTAPLVRLLRRVQLDWEGEGKLAKTLRQSVLLSLLDTRCIFAVLCLAGFALPFVPTLILLLLMLAAFALYVLNVLLGRIELRPLGLTGVFCLLFALLYAVSAVTGEGFPGSLEQMLMFLGLMCAIPVASCVLEKDSWRDAFVTVLILSACLVSLHGVYQYIVGVPMDPAWVDKENYAELTTRAYSTFGNPNVMGEYLVVLTSLSVAMLWKAKGFFKKTFFLGTTLLLAVGLLTTGSRGAMIGLAFSAFVFALFAEHRLLPFGAMVAAAIPFVMPASMWDRLMGAFTGTDSSTKYRMSIYGACFKMVNDYLLAGIGVGAFAAVYPRYVYSASNAYHSHNLFLQVLLELGVLGFVPFMLLLFFWAQRLYRTIALDKTRGRFLPGVVLSGMAGLLVQGLTDHLWFNYRIVLLFWLIIGIGCSFKKEAGK